MKEKRANLQHKFALFRVIMVIEKYQEMVNIMNIESITKENINNIKYDDVIVIFFAESGAIGEAGS